MSLEHEQTGFALFAEMVQEEKDVANFIERERKASQKMVDGWRNTVRQLWVKMCGHDGIETDAMFVVFSNDNPYQVFYDRALQNYYEAKRTHESLGYAGLKLQGGKAVFI